MFDREFSAALLSASCFKDRDVILFEDEDTERDLFPLAVLRPSWEIRYGCRCLREMVHAIAGAGTTIAYRPRVHMSAMSAQLSGEKSGGETGGKPAIFINGRLLSMRGTSANFPSDWPQTVVDSNGRPLIAFRSASETKDLWNLSGTELAHWLVQKSETVPQIDVAAAGFSWDYVAFNSAALTLQFGNLPKSARAQALQNASAGVQIVGDAPVLTGHDVRVLPSVVFDTRQGAIFIGDETEIEPFCYLQGPLFIGNSCRIKSGTRLYSGSTFGEQSRVGGEITNSILQGFVNKQHDGFLGNSHLGSWVNLGADTTVSNLRNDYGTVKMKVGGKLLDSGSAHVGSIIGDHTKTGINTMLNTGTVAGVACNIFGADYPPRFIRSFSWGGSAGFKNESLSRTLNTAEIVVSRRGKKMTEAERELLTRHYHETVRREES